MTVKRKYLMLIFALGLISQTVESANKMKPTEIFKFGTSTPGAESQKIVEQSDEDFRMVLKGKNPKHAKIDSELGIAADGGTAVYNGLGYTITVFKRIAEVGGVQGYFYGPQIEYKSPHINVNAAMISEIKFLSRPEMEKLLSGKSK